MKSVGKWERGEGFPDITLLPKIAFYFNVTVDELLSVDQIRVEETICEYLRQSEIFQQNGENQKNLEMWEKAYAEFPNDCRVIEGLMFAINREAVYPCPQDKATLIITLGEELLQLISSGGCFQMTMWAFTLLIFHFIIVVLHSSMPI